MLHLHLANQLEVLTDALGEEVRAERAGAGRGFFHPIELVTSTSTLRRWLELALSRRLGIAANLRAALLDRWLAARIPRERPERLLERGALRSLLLAELSDEALLAEPLLAPVRAYLDGAAPADERLPAGPGVALPLERRRLQLAGRLASLLIGAMLDRPALLRAWEAGRACPELVPPDGLPAASEPWQRRLWERVRARRDALAAGGGPRWVAPHELGALLATGALELPGAVHVVGLSWIGALYRELVGQLAERCQVHLYQLAPVLHFQDDVPPAWRADAPLLARLPRRGAGPHPRPADSTPASPAPPTSTAPLLRLWGRVGREQARLVDGLRPARVDARFGPPPAPAGSLLGRLQAALLRQDPPAAAATSPSPGADGSFALLACPGRRREAEAVADEVWTRLLADPTLRLHEVAVAIAGDEPEAWLPHLASAFAAAHDLPLSPTGLALAEPRPLLAIRALLELPLGPWSRQQLLAILTHPNVLGGLPPTDPAAWEGWCRALAIVGGRDRADQAGTYLELDLYNWDQGLRRLALGAFLAGPRSGEPDPVVCQGEEYLPLDLAQSLTADAGRLVLLARSLLADARFAAEGLRPLAEWGRLLRALVTTWLRPVGPGDEALLGRAAHALGDLARLDASGAPVFYATAREAALDALSGLAAGGGRPLTEGVVVAPLERLSGLPFRVVFVLGLDEARFPARPGADLLDLRLAQRLPGDVSPRERDEQRLLELLCAARERVVLSYLAREPETGAPLEPSPVIRQLESALVEGGLLAPEALPGLTRAVSLRRFDPAPAPHLPAARAEARALALGEDLRRHLRAALPAGRPLPARAELWRRLGAEARAALTGPLEVVSAPAPPPPPGGVTRVSLAALRQFLEAPLQSWARHRLGLSEEEDEDGAAGEDEPFEAGALVTTVGLRALFLGALRAGDPEGLAGRLEAGHRALLRRGERGGELPSGLFLERAAARQARTLACWRAQLEQALGTPLPAPLTYRFGPGADAAPQGGTAPGPAGEVLLPPLALTLPGGRRVELVGSPAGSAVPVVAGDPGQGVRGLVQLVTGFDVPEHHLLQATLDQAALAAGGVACAAPFLVCVAHGATARRQNGHAHLRPFAADEARAWLGALVGDLLTRAHDRLLPYEVALEWLRQSPGRALPLDELVRLAAIDTWTRLREDWGPITDARAYPPPADGEALAVARYGPYLERLRLVRPGGAS